MNNRIGIPNKNAGTFDRARRRRAQAQQKLKKQIYIQQNSELMDGMITTSNLSNTQSTYGSVQEFRDSKTNDKRVDMHNLSTKNSIDNQIKRDTIHRVKQQQEADTAATRFNQQQDFYYRTPTEDMYSTNLEDYNNEELTEYYAMELGQPVFEYGGTTYTVESFARSLLDQGAAEAYLSPYISKSDVFWLRTKFQPNGVPLDYNKLLSSMITKGTEIHDSMWTEGNRGPNIPAKSPADIIIEAMQKYGASVAS